MRGRQRQPGLVWPRQVSMYLAREVAGISLARIGAFFGRDHSTVRHACERVSEEIIRNPKLASEVRELTTELAS
jgi:chromosomal replication initiator protein